MTEGVASSGRAVAVAGDPRAGSLRLRHLLVFLYAMAMVVLFAKTFFEGRLVINRTASVPLGIYWLARSDEPHRGTVVAFPIPEHLRALFLERMLIPSPFFELLAKPVAAVGGDHVCTRGDELYINGRIVAPISRVDSKGREMPRASLCRRLEEWEVFVLTATDSFDSRYLGPISKSTVRGTLHMLIPF